MASLGHQVSVVDDNFELQLIFHLIWSDKLEKEHSLVNKSSFADLFIFYFITIIFI